MNSSNFKIPAVFFAGDSILWRIDSADHPASDGWTLVYLLRNSTDEIDLTSTADGDTHVIRQAPSVSNGYVAGTSIYRKQFIKGNQTVTVEQGGVRIVPSFADGSVDGRSPAQIGYDNICAMLTGKAASGVYEYEIRGRRLKSYTLDELLRLKNVLWQDLQRENIATGMNNGNAPFRGQIRVRFAR